jgi:metal-sulfur cluster biosynthetic enzyme
MNADELRRSVMAALAKIAHPATGRDLVAGGHVQNVEVDDAGGVRFQFLLRPEDPGDMVKEARAAVEALPGVTELKVNVQLPQMAPAGGGGRKGGLKPGSVPAPTPKPGILSQPRSRIAGFGHGP